MGELLSTQRKSEKNGFFGPFLGPRGSPAGASIWAQKGPENALFFRYCAHPHFISYYSIEGPFLGPKMDPKKGDFWRFFRYFDTLGFWRKNRFSGGCRNFPNFRDFSPGGNSVVPDLILGTRSESAIFALVKYASRVQ